MLALGMALGMPMGWLLCLIFIDMKPVPDATLFDWRYDPDLGTFPQGEFDD